MVDELLLDVDDVRTNRDTRITKLGHEMNITGLSRCVDRRMGHHVEMPSVLFLCVHNAGRSQMAAGFMREMAGGYVEVYSGGSEPADEVNPVAVEAMAERGIDIAGSQPERWHDETLGAADVIVTMGCGDTCPVLPGKRYVDWELDDPAGRSIETVRPIRDEIERRVRRLVEEMSEH